MTIDEQLDMLMGGTAVVISREELKEQASSLGRPLRVKLGVDPTAPDIHLGHTVAIEKLRQFQNWPSGRLAHRGLYRHHPETPAAVP